jgi:hypothetical protein
VQCAGSSSPSNPTTPYLEDSGALSPLETNFYLRLVQVLLHQPRFLSVTLVPNESPSVLLERSLLPVFGPSLLGDKEGILIPIMLDLRTLPLESTGIVCGVAGKLVEDITKCPSDSFEYAELSYLSTARAGAVVLPEENLDKALEALKPLRGIENGISQLFDELVV